MKTFGSAWWVVFPGLALGLLTSTPGYAQLTEILAALKNPQSKRVLVAAHRGDWIWAPENSLQGFQHCLDWGVDIIELDVRLTRDGQAVVLHDTTLDRTTTGKGRILDHTLAEVQQLNLKDATGVVTTAKVPTLREVLRLTRGKCIVYLDKAADKIDQLLPILQEEKALSGAMLVLDFPAAVIRQKLGPLVDSLIVVPVVSDQTPHPQQHLAAFWAWPQPPWAFQFRMKQTQGPAFPLLPSVLVQQRKLFVAATWRDHTAGHDDQISRDQPALGWGWLLEQGFQILETNHPQALLAYLREKGRR